MSKNAKTMICPFCDEELRFGVKVCRGCQAEITYDDGTGAAGVLGLLFLGLSYALFFTGFLGDSFFDKLTRGAFWGLLLLDIFFLLGAIGSINQEPKANFERKKFR